MSPGPLFPTLLGASFERLPASVRAMHQGRHRVLARGRTRVEGDVHRSARLLRQQLGLPSPTPDAPIEVCIEPIVAGERWTRRFARKPMTSTLRPNRALACGFDERIGPAQLAFALDADAHGMRWTVAGGGVSGIPLPRGLLGRVEAHCGERDGRYRFDVDVTLPWIGRLVAYSGWLVIVDGD